MTIINTNSISGINSITAQGSSGVAFYDSSGSSERLRITSGGDVNIGPSANANGHGLLTLSQSASAAFNALVIQQGNTAFTATDGLQIGIDAGVNAYFKLYENRDFYFTTGTSNTEKLRITAAGNVGVGTNVLSASSKLTLFEESGNGQTLEIKAKNSGGVGSQPGIKFTANNGDNIGGVYGDVNSDTLKIQTGGTDSLTITSGGNVQIADGDLVIGTSGHGIDFSVTGDGSGTVGTNGELLDEYEEGFFTPTIVNGFSSANLQYKAGRYTRIGNHVYCDFYIRFNTGAEANGSPIQIGGLPFTISNLTYGAPGLTGNLTRGGGGTTFQDLQSSDGNITFYGSASNNIFNCYVGGTAWATVTTNGGANAKFIIGIFQYHAQ